MRFRHDSYIIVLSSFFTGTSRLECRSSQLRFVFYLPRNGARVGFLTKEGLLSALKELGLAAIGGEEASDLTRKLIVAKKARCTPQRLHIHTDSYFDI